MEEEWGEVDEEEDEEDEEEGDEGGMEGTEKEWAEKDGEDACWGGEEPGEECKLSAPFSLRI